jgi:hypothetical protein
VPLFQPGGVATELLARIAAWTEALTHALTGRFDEAERAYREVAASFGESTFWSNERGMALLGIFCVRLVQGREGELVDEARWMWERWRHIDATSEIYALALNGAGRADEAARTVAGAAAPVRYDYFYDLLLTLRARRALALGDRQAGERTYADLLQYGGHLAGAACACISLGPVAQTLGDLAGFLERPAEAAGHYRRAAEVADLAGAAHWSGLARDALRALGSPAA